MGACLAAHGAVHIFREVGGVGIQLHQVYGL